MSVRAKFQVGLVTAPREVTHYLKDGTNRKEMAVDISLYPVTGGSEENDSFYSSTPAGLITLQIVNEKASEQFLAGKVFYVDFTEA